MKKILFILPVLALTLLLAASCSARKDKGIAFMESSWQDAVNKARTEHKAIFLDIYATWCGPCKMLRSQTFTDRRVGEYFNEHFVNVSFDGETGEGAMLAQKFNIQAYPSLFIVSPDGSVVNASVGFQSAKELLRFGKTATGE